MNKFILVGALVAIGMVIYQFLETRGLFKKIEFKETVFELDSSLIVLPKRGRYQNDLGPLFEKLAKDIASVNKDIKYESVGLYFDEPDEVNGERFAIGIHLNSIDDAADRKKVKDLLIKEGFVADFIRYTEKYKTMHTAFPFIDMISMFIGIFRVYPAGDVFFKENNIFKEGQIIAEVMFKDKPKETQFYFFVDDVSSNVYNLVKDL